MARKACHNANLPHISPAVVPPQHGMQEPNTANLLHTSPTMAPPQHGTQGPTNANLLHRTPPPHHPQHDMQNGAVVEMVGVVDSGMAVVGMAATARHSYYLRLYIFYLCNKLILFLYFVIKANKFILLKFILNNNPIFDL